MSQHEIDDYLTALDEPKRSTLEELRRTIVSIIPEAEQGISARVPAFRLDGTLIAGFAAFKNHPSYCPHSGSVLAELGDELAGNRVSKGALHSAVGTPLPAPLVSVRLSERSVNTDTASCAAPVRIPLDISLFDSIVHRYHRSSIWSLPWLTPRHRVRPAS